MDLFSISRHGFSESTSDENLKLDAVLKRIELNKLITKKRKIAITPESTPDTNSKIAKINNVDLLDDKVESKTGPEEKIKKQISSEELGFTVLGKANANIKPEIKRVLPKWLANPTVISTNLSDLQLKVSDIKVLNKGLRKLLKANGIKYFFPVQGIVIPWILETHAHIDVMVPRDVCVSSPTGSGKTLSFVLPVVQVLQKYTIKRIRALVILPTQDLAHQVYTTFKKYTQNTNIGVILISGKCSFTQEQKQLSTQNEGFGYVSKFDIVVCTAGRLVDHLKNTKGFDLRDLEFLIIDEADRVLNSMQNDWLYHLENHIYQNDCGPRGSRILNLQTLSKEKVVRKLLFSATLSQDPEKLQKLSSFQPKLFTSVVETESPAIEANENTFIGKYTTPKELTEKYIVSSADLKPLVLYKFITDENLHQILIFTHSVESVHRLSILLKLLSNDKLCVEEISSHLPAKSRNEIISKFSNKEIDILVCTDSLARGMDLPKVQCVISYSMPKYIKTYIHRAGRTARAGEQGLAITMVQENQVNQFKTLVLQANKNNIEEVSIHEAALEPLGDSYKEALQNLKTKISKESKGQIVKAKGLKSKSHEES